MGTLGRPVFPEVRKLIFHGRAPFFHKERNLKTEGRPAFKEKLKAAKRFRLNDTRERQI